ncbi:hypothetical protein [Polyangium jinanense]|uniref:Uncharacterized protein n=1 Tax=Polyangium jinanense TaxID=2829994 RepID=A0A9X3WVM8_9BACT|nr:hypothetical protein [Polyangium jinanense]MDC3953911.1 hypothetical protein [Polyangium jinanense]MDC3957876.1 hypothetical protein [Polyangium jinanense]MDC3978962.1 hypothetical protein [Polyangium jinanense]MDC3982133.1 hypothetical protein [Polyangium jinanense]
MIDVSVPCPCGADVSFQHTACPACKTPVSRALRDDLEARLERAHTEYGEAKQSMRRSATVLFVGGALYVVLALFVFYLARSVETVSTSIDSWADTLPLLANGGLGLLLITCAAWSRRSPNAAFAVALGIWLLSQILGYVAAPALFFLAFMSASGIAEIFAKGGLLVSLVRGLLAAGRVDAIRAEVARGAAA